MFVGEDVSKDLQHDSCDAVQKVKVMQTYILGSHHEDHDDEADHDTQKG